MKIRKQWVAVGISALVANGALASLVVETTSYISAANDNSTVALGTGVSASIGDVIVLARSSSKSYSNLWSVASGDGGVVAPVVSNWADKNAAVVYYTVTAAGTFNVSLDRSNSALSYDTLGLYVIGSDAVGGSVVEAALAQSYVGPNISTNNTLAYGTLADPGILVEAAAVAGFYSYPSGYTANINAGNSRGTFWGSFAAGDVSSDYVTLDITKNSRTVGFAFSEVIPEPATLGVVALFGGAMLFIRRRLFM